ncbi:helix-turn-helix domain-containing protein [Streptomyces albogriseolus]|uniref:helix-turn-helix domain-containing protein n=1 Tax=Streptomyces albogriseolus TaxID=1887 RepID=UPI00346123B8
MDNDEMTQALASLRRQLRERLGTAGLTTTDLHRRTRLGRTTVSNALNDRPERPSWNTVAAIAKALGFSAAEVTALHQLWEQAGPQKATESAPPPVASAPEPSSAPQPVQPNRLGGFSFPVPGRPRTWLLAAIALTAAAVGVTLWQSDFFAADGGTESDKPSSRAAVGTSGPLLITHTWPTLKSCDGVTAVAMPAGGEPLDTFAAQNQDFRAIVTKPENKGGTWGAGHLYLNLSSKDDTPITIDEIHLSTRVPKRIGAPAWVALTQGGCGDVKERVFELNLDKPSLIDKGVQGAGTADTPPPTNALGSGFTVSAKDPAIVRVDAAACRGNYEWSLIIEYTHNGKPLEKPIGPFKTFSITNKNTRVYVPNPMTGEVGDPLPEASSPVGCPASS